MRIYDKEKLLTDVIQRWRPPGIAILRSRSSETWTTIERTGIDHVSRYHLRSDFPRVFKVRSIYISILCNLAKKKQRLQRHRLLIRRSIGSILRHADRSQLHPWTEDLTRSEVPDPECDWMGH